MRDRTTTSIHRAVAWLVCLLAFSPAAGLGYADDSRSNGQGPDRGRGRYEGHRGQDGPGRSREYRGGNPHDAGRGRDGSRRIEKRPDDGLHGGREGNDRSGRSREYRDGRNHDGNRNGIRPLRPEDYLRGNPHDPDRAQPGARRAIETRRGGSHDGGRPRGGAGEGRHIRDADSDSRYRRHRDDGDRDSRYKKRWDYDDRNLQYRKRWDHNGPDSRYSKPWRDARPPRRAYHSPRDGRYSGHAYRRHDCPPGVRCYHSPRRPYYWRHSPGYFAVRPAIGTLYLSLPLGCAGLYIGGSIYYFFDSVYYRPVPSGYVVVAPPMATVPPITSGEVEYTRVSVTVELLNVRSGPGNEHAVIRQLRQGEILEVEEDSDGWLYVTLSDGQQGWVDARYTAPMVYVDG